MYRSSNGVVPINSYALVTYTPDPLGSFLDHLRQELVVSCRIKSHVTLLPPRLLVSPVKLAWEQAQDRLRMEQAFEIGLGEVEVFPGTNVIYLAVTEGRIRLEELHSDLNTRHLGYDEPFEYHPHLTLAQALEPDQVDATLDLARRRWAEFTHARTFLVKTLTFVQNTVQNQWVDRAMCFLDGQLSRR